jgi:hypothetical protein
MTESQKVLLIWLNERSGNRSLSQLIGLLSNLSQTLLGAQHIAQAVSGAETAVCTVAWGELGGTGTGTLPVICAILGSGEVH